MHLDEIPRLLAMESDPASLFELASKVSTPLALSGFIAAALFLILRQILKIQNLFPALKSSERVIILIIERLFVLALIAMVLGFAGYVVLLFRPTPATTESKHTYDSEKRPLEPTQVERLNTKKWGVYTGSWKDGEPHGRGAVVGMPAAGCWTYDGDTDFGHFEGQGAMSAPLGEWYKGIFHFGKFVSGKCSLATFDDTFGIAVGDGTRIFGGRYEGQCVAVDTKSSSEAGLLQPRKVCNLDRDAIDTLQVDGQGVFTLNTLKYPNSLMVPVTYTLEGEWHDGEFKGQGKVTRDNPYATLEGEFRNSILIRGKANNVDGFFYGMPSWCVEHDCRYTGEVKEGSPDGEGKVVFATTGKEDKRAEDIYPVQFNGELREGKWWVGQGYLPEKCSAFWGGKVGQWKDGVFYNGREDTMKDGHLNRLVYSNGRVVSRDVYADTDPNGKIIAHYNN